MKCERRDLPIPFRPRVKRLCYDLRGYNTQQVKLYPARTVPLLYRREWNFPFNVAFLMPDSPSPVTGCALGGLKISVQN